MGGNEDSAFAINPGSGIIVTRGPNLDFERVRFYNLTVEAASMANGKRDRCTVNVHVLDVNDNAPVFLPYPSSVSVPEHYGGAGTVIAEVEATDRDSGIFGQVGSMNETS